MRQEIHWLGPLFKEAQPYASTLGKYLAKIVVHVHFDPVEDEEALDAWVTLLKEMTYLGLDKEQTISRDIAITIESLKTLGQQKLTKNMVQPKVLEDTFSQAFSTLFSTLATYPQLFYMFDHAEFIEDILGIVAHRYLTIFKLIPAVSDQAINLMVHLKEPSFNALSDLEEEDFNQLTELTTIVLHRYYKSKVRPLLEASLKGDIKGTNLLLPLIDDAVAALPPARCVTAVVSLLCTPREQLTQGRIISIVLQELGGLYVKISQVLAEIAPPHIGKELKQQQDNVGGIFGSKDKSWKYVLQVFERPEMKKWKELLIIPQETQNYFAGASVGAIYLFNLSDYGKNVLKIDHQILLKVQRPGLKELFKEQEQTLLNIITRLEAKVEFANLSLDEESEVYGLISALRRSIINYAFQSQTELDFRIEKTNADRVSELLINKENIKVPHFYEALEDLALMERMKGSKITSVVRSKYLEKRFIANDLAEVYLNLLFNHGIIWADPHAGNILYDSKHSEINLIDLNPCFTWEKETIQEFIYFLYRLILGDEKGVLESLMLILENPLDLRDEKSLETIKVFLNKGDQGAFIRYLGEFVRILSECNINLKTEVQAALRGISQIYITCNSISSRNSFGQLLQKQLGYKTLAKIVWSIGPIKVIKTALPIVFDALKNAPDEEVGPSIDERDISRLSVILKTLTDESVCNIELNRSSPEENTKLALSSDGSRLVRSSYLTMNVMEESKPVTVKYMIEIPSKEWLKERQEYIKLIGIGYSFCIVECLEQLRRFSLDDYWQVIDSWNHNPDERTVIEAHLIGDVKLAARKLFSRRFKNIWVSEYLPLSLYHRTLWRILIYLEERFESREQGYLYLFSKKFSDARMGKFTLGTIQRTKVIIYRIIISWIKSLIKKSKFEMNLLPLTTEELMERMVFGLKRN